MIRTVIVGLDAFDPKIFERLYEEGRLPNLASFVKKNSYSEFTVSNPPQSEVSWTSIATGLGPGEHGLFDFVHRNPQNYSPFASLLPTKKTIGGIKFASPFNARTLFDAAVDHGFPATSLWWPATFPARPQAAVQTIPGLGTPDILGRLGVGAYFSTENGREQTRGKVPVYSMQRKGKSSASGSLHGPLAKNGEPLQLDFDLKLNDDGSAHFQTAKIDTTLQPGTWSPIMELSFKMGLFFKIRVIARVILTKINPEIGLYVLPLQIHPLKSLWPYGTPGGFIKRAWQVTGPFLTLGWPQDTTALEENFINDEQFLALCDSIYYQRRKTFFDHLSQFNEGILACVFDTLDRVQHMFLRDRPDIVESWYERLDQLIGDTVRALSGLPYGKKTKLIVLSDHGFASFHHKVHLNRWLMDSGYLKAPGVDASPTLRGVNWQESSTYAVGLNSIYLNLAGREGKGIVKSADSEMLLQKLRKDLLAWQGADGKPVVAEALPGKEAFPGPFNGYGPDLFVGYAPGYRASQATGLGGWAKSNLEANHDHWGADHCMNAASVPGVIFTSIGLLQDVSQPSYRDIPAMATGIAPDSGSSAPPPDTAGDEDQAAVEERLRDLGYF